MEDVVPSTDGHSGVDNRVSKGMIGHVDQGEKEGACLAHGTPECDKLRCMSETGFSKLQLLGKLSKQNLEEG